MHAPVSTQPEHYQLFRSLHQRAEPFIMPNAWDGGSAVLLKRAGFQALGSSSAAIAWALARQDGARAVALDEAVANATLIGAVSGLPINGDLEDGFGPDPEDCALTVQAAITGGLAGLGIEDTTANPARPIHDFDQAVARMRRAAQVAHGRILLTGRTDNFLMGRPDLDDTVRRLVAFAEVGADVLYAPGLPDIAAIRTVVEAVSPRPVNVLVGPGANPIPLSDLAAAGVRRISLGGALYRASMRGLVDAAQDLARGSLAAVARGVPGSEISNLFPQA